MTLKITGIKIDLEDALDISDALSCLGYPGGAAEYCKGGRLIPNGYVCPHCGGDEECLSPRKEAMEKMKEDIKMGKIVLQPPAVCS